MRLLVVGSVAFDAVRTPRGSLSRMNWRMTPYSGGSDHMMFIDRGIPGVAVPVVHEHLIAPHPAVVRCAIVDVSRRLVDHAPPGAGTFSGSGDVFLVRGPGPGRIRRLQTVLIEPAERDVAPRLDEPGVFSPSVAPLQEHIPGRREKFQHQSSGGSRCNRA